MEIACCKDLCRALVLAWIIVAIGGNYVPPIVQIEDDVTVADPLAALRQFPQNWGLVDVRPGAHKFYWLFNTTHASGPTKRPLIIWLQGGPGAASSRHGLFDIIGPVDTDFQPRNHSWVTEASLLFVDHPVGAGFSYADDDDDLSTSMYEDAEDLLALLEVFLLRHPGFRVSPLWVFGQSYGGKMGAAFMHLLHRAVAVGHIDCNPAGVALGNSWISPESFTMTWGDFLYWMSFLDEASRDRVNAAARRVQDAIHARNWTDAFELWREAQWTVIQLSPVDFYNVMQLTSNPYGTRHERDVSNQDRNDIPLYLPDTISDEVMDSLIVNYLNLSLPKGISYGGQKYTVLNTHKEDFLQPVVHIVDDLLTSTNLNVVVYQGQLDLICDTVGAMTWVRNLTWDGLADFLQGERDEFVNDLGQTDLYAKGHDNFMFYWVLGAGHSVPKDQPETALRMLRRILDGVDY